VVRGYARRQHGRDTEGGILPYSRDFELTNVFQANALMDDQGRLNQLGVRYIGGNISATSGSESGGRLNNVPSMRTFGVLFASSLIGLGILL